MGLSSPQLTNVREGNDGGRPFVAGMGPALKAGQRLRVRRHGYPAPPDVAAKRRAGARGPAARRRRLGGARRRQAVGRGGGAPDAGARGARRSSRELLRLEQQRKHGGSWTRQTLTRERAALVARARTHLRRTGHRGPGRRGGPGVRRVTFDFDRVAVRDVSRHYGRRRALSRVSLECRAGEVLGLLGPNGAGKSTLLSILATLLAPSAGEVRYGERDGAPRPARRFARASGFLSHDLHLYPELTARREPPVLRAALRPRPTWASRVARALDRAGLTARARRPRLGLLAGHAPAARARAGAAARPAAAAARRAVHRPRRRLGGRAGVAPEGAARGGAHHRGGRRTISTSRSGCSTRWPC